MPDHGLVLARDQLEGEAAGGAQALDRAGLVGLAERRRQQGGDGRASAGAGVAMVPIAELRCAVSPPAGARPPP